jgi:hypothetical protein
MITHIEFDRKGNFKFSGTVKLKSIDFSERDLDTRKFFETGVRVVIDLKKTIIKALADDRKILGDERVMVVKQIDRFLTIIFGFALVTSDVKNRYVDDIRDRFLINIEINDMRYFKGEGSLVNVSSNDIIDYNPWMDDKIVGLFKTIISQFNGKGDKQSLRENLITLIFNLFSLRYKVEYI